MNYYDDWDLWLGIACCMKNYGGSFAAAIGQAMIVADGGNQRRLEGAFRDLMDKYRPDNWK